MGYPERTSTLQCREIKEISVLSQRESGIGSPVPEDLADCRFYFLAALMP